MAANHLFFKLAFLSFVLLPIFVSAAFPTKTLSKVNAVGPYYGVITSSRRVEKEFFVAVDFVPNKEFPYVDLAGKRFRLGVVGNKNVVFVRSGGGLVNSAATTQILLGSFSVQAVISLGTSGSTNNSLKIGDVVVPKQFANTGLWDWVNPNADIASDDLASLDIKDYNVPKGGSNSLGRIGYRSEEFFSETGGGAGNGIQKLWFEVDDLYHRIASNLQDDNAGNKLPNIVTDVKGSSSDIYVNNAAYREFLYQTFQVSSVDTASAAIVQTSLSNGNPRVIVFRGLSNVAGAATPRTLQAKNAAKNVARVVAQFLNILPNVVQDKHVEAKLIKQVLDH